MKVNIEEIKFGLDHIGKKAINIFGQTGIITNYMIHRDDPIEFTQDDGRIFYFRIDGTFYEVKHRCLFLGHDIVLSVSNEDLQKPTTFKASEIFNDDQVKIDIVRGNNEYFDKKVFAEKLSNNIKHGIKYTVKDWVDSYRFIQNSLNVPEKKKKPIKQLFIEFLKREQVIERYKRNWLFCNSIRHERPIKKRTRYISNAFLWTLTPEGQCFWSKINYKWLEYLESIGRQL